MNRIDSRLIPSFALGIVDLSVKYEHCGQRSVVRLLLESIVGLDELIWRKVKLTHVCERLETRL